MNFNEMRNKIYPLIKVQAFVEQAKNSTIKADIPVIKFLADLVIVFVVDKGDIFEILQRNQIPPEISDDDLYQLSAENLSRDIEFSVQQAKYDVYGIIAGGNFEASSLCLRNVWEYISDKMGESLIVSAPARDIVLFVGVSEKEKLDKMKELSENTLQNGDHTLTKELLLYDRETKNFTIYK